MHLCASESHSNDLCTASSRAGQGSGDMVYVCLIRLVDWVSTLYDERYKNITRVETIIIIMKTYNNQ